MSVTDLAREKAEQTRWRLRPRFHAETAFDQLLVNEFISPERQATLRDQALRRIVAFASSQVPYYRDLFRSHGLAAKDIRGAADLSRLPILTKHDLRANIARLQPHRLPAGEQLGSSAVTTGTTGTAVRVALTRTSHLMFAAVKQRECRWFRDDPRGLRAAMRSGDTLPRLPDGEPLKPGVTARYPFWPLVGEFFETGPFLARLRSENVDEMADWLEESRPNYLVTTSANLESLALTFINRSRPPLLQGLQSTNEALTGGQRRRIESVFGVPVHQNYGLNEIGVVASRCAEGERYHVHAELAHVEVVDAAGAPASPGKTGRLIATNLMNPAMPLLRYETDDLAVAVEGPCPCGRTLPTFGDVTSRLSRTAPLPAGSHDLIAAFLKVLEDLPNEQVMGLRQYNLHQFHDETYELRLVAKGPISPLVNALASAWRSLCGPTTRPLRIVGLDRMPFRGLPKNFRFTSDFTEPKGSPQRVRTGGS